MKPERFCPLCLGAALLSKMHEELPVHFRAVHFGVISLIISSVYWDIFLDIKKYMEINFTCSFENGSHE